MRDRTQTEFRFSCCGFIEVSIGNWKCFPKGLPPFFHALLTILLDKRFIDLRPLISHKVPLTDYPTLLKTATTPSSGYLKGVVRLSSEQ